MELYEAKWTAATRKAHKAAGGYFAGPNDTFPLKDASDVADAWGLAGHAANPDQVRANIKRWAKDNGHYDALPDTAKDEKQESAASIVDVGQRPKKKIATLKVCFLEYNARSLNGRIYPKVTCDAIFQAAKRKIASDDLPATVFVSHEAANSNGNMELVGRVSKVWQEASKFYANLDLADTRAAHDMLALAEGGYLRSESMRVAGVELRHDNQHDLPLVVISDGVEPDFLGIDLTTRPGLADSARILQTLYESQGKAFHLENFAVDDVFIESKEPKEVNPPAMPIIPIYIQAALGTLQEAFPSKAQEAHARIHDHLAGVLDQTLGPKHGSESARFIALVEGQLDEAGKAIAMKHMQHLVAAHDEAARACAMECESCYAGMMPGYAPSDTDSDGDDPAHGIDPDNDGESQKGNTPLTLTPEQIQEALKLVAEQGYQVTPPKSAEQQKLEALEAQLVEQNAKLAQLLEAQNSAPTRQTLSESQLNEQSLLQPESMYMEGDYLNGTLKPQNWRSLGDRRVPWPKDLDPKLALHEMAPFLTANLLTQEANAMGRSLDAFIRPDEQI